MLGTGQHRASRQTLLQIMNSWLLPKLLYGIEIVSRQLLNFQTQIAPLYHIAIRCATVAFVTSPIASLMCESSLKPFDQNITDNDKIVDKHALIQQAIADFTTLIQQTHPSVTKLIQIGTRPLTTVILLNSLNKNTISTI